MYHYSWQLMVSPEINNVIFILLLLFVFEYCVKEYRLMKSEQFFSHIMTRSNYMN